MNSRSTLLPRPGMSHQIQAHNLPFREVCCEHCGHLLLEEFVFRGRVKIACANCGKITVMVFRYRKKPKRSSHKIT